MAIVVSVEPLRLTRFLIAVIAVIVFLVTIVIAIVAGDGTSSCSVFAVVVEILRIERVLAVVDRVIDLVVGHVRQRRLVVGLGVCVGVRLLLRLAIRCRGGCGVWIEPSSRRVGIGRRDALCSVRLGCWLRVGGSRSAHGCSAEAVALHFLCAKLRDDGGGDGFGDDIEFSVLELVVYDEAHERLAVHDEALVCSLCGEVGFGFAGEGGIVSEQALIVVGVDEHRIERGGVLLARAHHLFSAHHLFCFFGYLHGRDRRVEHFVGGAFEGIFHAAFEFREKAH